MRAWMFVPAAGFFCMLALPLEAAQPDAAAGGAPAARESIQSYTVEKRDEAVRQAKRMLDAFDARLRTLEERLNADSARWSAAVSARIDKELAALKAQRAQSARQAERLGNASKKAWEATKSAFVKSYRRLQRRLEKLNSDMLARKTIHDRPSSQSTGQ